MRLLYYFATLIYSSFRWIAKHLPCVLQRTALRPLRADSVVAASSRCLGDARPPAITGKAFAASSICWSVPSRIPAILAHHRGPGLANASSSGCWRSATTRAASSRCPTTASYRSYTDLGRRFVLWNVFATPELSLEPRQWCFPVAGCVNYRGYFDEAAPAPEAAQLASTGDDVYVGGVPAYSTLGYFNDPMLSSVIRYPDTEVARLDLPRACAPGRVREGRHGIQRILCRGGRGGGDRPLARGAERPGAGGAVQHQPALSRRIPDPGRTRAQRARDALRKSPPASKRSAPARPPPLRRCVLSYDALKKNGVASPRTTAGSRKGPATRIWPRSDSILRRFRSSTPCWPRMAATLAGSTLTSRLWRRCPRRERDSALAAAAPRIGPLERHRPPRPSRFRPAKRQAASCSEWVLSRCLIWRFIL